MAPLDFLCASGLKLLFFDLLLFFSFVILEYDIEPAFCVPVVNSAPQKSLGEEVNELTSSRLLKLEKDNQTLQKTVEELRGAASQDGVSKRSKVSQENQRLNQKVSNEMCNVVILWLISFVFYPLFIQLHPNTIAFVEM